MLEVAEADHLAAARAGDQQAFSRLAEPYRRELQVHCYRILGSLHDAEDMVQETMLRAWRRLDTFEGRASFRAWLYKIATHACLDALDKRQRRTLPALAYPAADPRAPVGPAITGPVHSWLEPYPDELLPETGPSPEAHFEAHESITLAFLAALQALPPRQRAALILRDALGWPASETADILELTVPAVKSALHRARATLAKHYHVGGLAGARAAPADEAMRALLDRFVHAWETADVAGLIALLKADAVLSMPPIPAWYRGRESVGLFIASAILTGEAGGRWHLRPTRANSQPAFAVYERDDAGIYRAYGLQVLTFDGNQLAEMTIFVDPEWVPRFGLPAEIKA